LRILAVGDIFGRPGREAVRTLLPGLRRDLEIDFVIANGENAAGGRGITSTIVDELLGAGVDVITSGNHIWDQKEIIPYLDEDFPILRPLNYPPTTPGRGCVAVGNALVVSLIGRVFVGNFDCPFRAMDNLLERVGDSYKVILVDFHAEATSEKMALGWYLDGRVTAVVGTHTHVGTADNRLFTKGTAYVSDLGMVGPRDSVIGSAVEDVLVRFLDQTPRRLTVAGGPLQFNSVMMEIDEDSGSATAITRVDRWID
jgi:metallophosphoesterase (TIGR00282 family)